MTNGLQIGDSRLFKIIVQKWLRQERIKLSKPQQSQCEIYLESKSSKPSSSFSSIFLTACIAFKTILPKRDTIAVLITTHKRESNRCINIF